MSTTAARATRRLERAALVDCDLAEAEVRTLAYLAGLSEAERRAWLHCEINQIIEDFNRPEPEETK